MSKIFKQRRSRDGEKRSKRDRPRNTGGIARGGSNRRRRDGAKSREKSTNDDGVRLQKALAAAGVGSRRQCEQLILEGRVDVDGQTVSELGTRVDPQSQKIRVDGEVVRAPKRKLYFLVNKPTGILSTSRDPAGRARVIDFAPTDKRLFTVGRLDKGTSGLILVTNDGELTDLLTHPRYGVEKTYLAQVAGNPSREALAKLERGVHLSEGLARVEHVEVRRAHRKSTLLEIVLAEGRNREVRRLLARLGHKVLSLRRIALGPLKLGNLEPGETRPLRPEEIEELYKAAHTRRKKSSRRSAKPQQRKLGSPESEGSEDGTEKQPRVEAIIDESLPLDQIDDEAALSLELTDPEKFEAMDSEAEYETVKVDLSPLGRGSSKKTPPRTIIGGGHSPNDQPRGKQRRRRGSGRPPRNRQGRGRKS
jgi:23S rRNA pseudouridine2605 synthase